MSWQSRVPRTKAMSPLLPGVVAPTGDCGPAAIPATSAKTAAATPTRRMPSVKHFLRLFDRYDEVAGRALRGREQDDNCGKAQSRADELRADEPRQRVRRDAGERVGERPADGYGRV